MGCDIHLRLEKRLKKEKVKVWDKYYTEKPEWQGCDIINAGETWDIEYMACLPPLLM